MADARDHACVYPNLSPPSGRRSTDHTRDVVGNAVHEAVTEIHAELDDHPLKEDVA
jgi:hypothetical protein